MASIGTTFKRNSTVFLLLIALLVLCFVIYLLRVPLIPFFVGIVIAYLVVPIVDWVDNRLPLKTKGHSVQRMVIVIVVLLAILALLGLMAYLVLSSLIESFSMFLANAPTLITKGLTTFGDWLDSLVQPLAPAQQQQAYDFINRISGSVNTWLQESFLSGLKFIPSTFTYVVGFLTLPFFLIIFMADVHRMGKSVYRLFSAEVARHIHNFFHILNRVVGRYIRAQLLMAVAMGIMAYIALLIIGINMAPALAMIAALLALIPIIGGVLAGIIGAIVTLAIAPAKVLLVIIAYVAINLLGGNVLLAKFQGDAVNIDASIVMVLIIVGGYVGGILGMVVITPLAAVVFALYNYVLDEMRSSAVKEEAC